MPRYRTSPRLRQLIHRPSDSLRQAVLGMINPRLRQMAAWLSDREATLSTRSRKALLLLFLLAVLGFSMGLLYRSLLDPHPPKNLRWLDRGITRPKLPVSDSSHPLSR